MTDEPQQTENSPRNSKHGAPQLDPYKFKPGQSGNPAGRPKKKPLTDAYRAALDQVVPEDIRLKLNLKPGATYAEVIAISMIKDAVTGKNKVQAASEIADRVEGKPDSRTEVNLSVEEVSDLRELTTEQLRAEIIERRKLALSADLGTQPKGQ